MSDVEPLQCRLGRALIVDQLGQQIELLDRDGDLGRADQAVQLKLARIIAAGGPRGDRPIVFRIFFFSTLRLFYSASFCWF